MNHIHQFIVCIDINLYVYSIAIMIHTLSTEIAQPTAFPSISPSDVPTNSPSVPTSTPTNYPSIEPTKLPSILPTIEPTIKPSVYPSIEPTKTELSSKRTNNTSDLIPIKWTILIAGLVGLGCCVTLLILMYILGKQIYSKSQNAMRKEKDLASISHAHNSNNNNSNNNNSNNDNIETPAAFQNEYETNQVKSLQIEGAIAVTGNKQTKIYIPDNNIPAFENEYNDDKEIIIQGTQIIYKHDSINPKKSAGNPQPEMEGSTQL